MGSAPSPRGSLVPGGRTPEGAWVEMSGRAPRAKEVVIATTGDRTAGATSDQRRWPRRVAQVSAAMLIAGAAINAILAAAAPQAYADLGTWTAGPEPLQQLWAATMGEHPRGRSVRRDCRSDLHVLAGVFPVAGALPEWPQGFFTPAEHPRQRDAVLA